jgi:hypothetical protein
VTTSKLLATMRITATLWAAALAVQAVTAGLLLSIPGGGGIHNAGALLVYLAGVAQLVGAVVMRRRGGSARLVVTGVVALLLALLQGALGWWGVSAVHVPLGALLLAAAAVQLAQVWAPHPTAVVARPISGSPTGRTGAG